MKPEGSGAHLPHGDDGLQIAIFTAAHQHHRGAMTRGFRDDQFLVDQRDDRESVRD